MEKWDILDCHGTPTGKTVVRGRDILAPGEFHLVVHIWVMSADGNFLIQRRSDNKKLMPGEWAATGGAAVAGEDSVTAAGRELFEELGIDSRGKLKLLMRIKRKNSFLDVWAITVNIRLESLHLQKSEVAAAKWVSQNTLMRMIEDGSFHNYGNEYFDAVFQKINDYRGAAV